MFITETSKASPQADRWAGGPRICRRKRALQAGYGDTKEEQRDEDTSASEDSDYFRAKPSLHIPPKGDTCMEDSDYTDNSSGKTLRCALSEMYVSMLVVYVYLPASSTWKRDY